MEYKRKYNLSKEENIFLVKRNIVDYIWKSVNLEGIDITYSETQAIYNGMAVSGYTIDEINAVNALKNAWILLLETIDADIDLEYIQEIHRTIGKFTIINPGSLRMDPAGVGGTKWMPEMPKEEKIEEDLKTIGIIDNPVDRALTITGYLMRTQAFYDGNKRLAMLIGNKVMIENGAGIISVKQEQINDFYKHLISFYETGNYEIIKDFLYENCIDGMNITRK